jgi:hypothetical protein
MRRDALSVITGNPFKGVLVVLVLVLGMPPEGAAQVASQEQCNAMLSDAEASYRARNYSEAIARLSDCFRVENLSEDGARRAYRLLALALLGQEQVVEAKLVIIQLLGLIPTYQPDPIQDSPT